MKLADVRRLEQPDGWQRFVEPWWLEQAELVKAVCKPVVKATFLRHRHDGELLFARFGIVNHWYHGVREDLEELTDILHLAGCADSLHDPKWGGLDQWRHLEPEWPPDDDLPFSPTLIHQALGLARNLAGSDVDPAELRSVVHWGGGIGLQTLMLRWWGGTHTEYVIDLPVMSVIQHDYLGHELGFEHVHLAETDVQEGVVNLVPLSRIDLVPAGHDLFIALHSLNESTVQAQYEVSQVVNWWNADRLLLEWTDDHPHFESSANWMALAGNLERQGRIPPRDRVRPHRPPTPTAERQAAAWEQQLKVPVLYLGRDNWFNVGGDDTSLASPQLAAMLKAVPVVVVDVGHVGRRGAYQWAIDLADKLGHRVIETPEALVMIRFDQIGNLEHHGRL